MILLGGGFAKYHKDSSMAAISDERLRGDCGWQEANADLQRAVDPSAGRVA